MASISLDGQRLENLVYAYDSNQVMDQAHQEWELWQDIRDDIEDLTDDIGDLVEDFEHDPATTRDQVRFLESIISGRMAECSQHIWNNMYLMDLYSNLHKVC